MYYAHIDHLGSLRLLSDANKNVVSRYHYDAWGKRTLVTGTNITNRGFTIHEHMPEFGLINMNARLYDPALGRFLSPDPYVVDGTYSQDYNRYTYARNNPLIYTDPTGQSMLKYPRDGDSYYYRGEYYYYNSEAGSGAGGYVKPGGGGFISSGGGGRSSSSYSYDWATGNYVNQNGTVVDFGEVTSWLSSNNYIAGGQNNVELMMDALRELYRDAAGIVRYNPKTNKIWVDYAGFGEVTRTAYSIYVGGGAQGLPSVPDKYLHGNHILSNLFDIAATQSRIPGDAAYKFLGKIAGTARIAGHLGTAYTTVNAGYNIYNNNANTLDKVDVLVGTLTLGSAGVAGLSSLGVVLFTNPVGWTIIGGVAVGGTVYFTGRMVYDWFNQY